MKEYEIYVLAGNISWCE